MSQRFQFEPDAEYGSHGNAEHSPWLILSVEDDVDFQRAIALALKGLTFEDRPVRLLTAASAKEAREILATHPDIAVMLIDVVMESDQAGLQLVKSIRTELSNDLSQLIILTGQPGVSSHNDVLREYEISEYWSKTELGDRLPAIVIANLRTYSLMTQLAAANERTHAAMILRDKASQAANLGFMEYDINARQLECSDSLLQIVGYVEGSFGPGNLLNAIEERVVPEDRPELNRRVFALASDPAPSSLTVRIRRADTNEERELSIFAALHADARNTHRYVTALVQDVTAANIRRRREAELAAAKTRFLANVSHELRTPLNAVIGSTNLLRETPLADDQREHVESVTHAGESLLALVNNLLDYAKLEAGEFRLNAEPLRLDRSLSLVGQIMNADANRKGIALTIDELPASLRRPLIGDPLRVRQILFNLVGNAIRFTEQGEVRLNLKLVAEDAQQLRIRFEVSDTGAGISASDFPRLFRSFSQLDDSDTRSAGGTGLGLSITKHLAEQMDGGVDLQSTLGKGSVFGVEIALAIPDGDEKHDNAVDDEQLSLEGVRLLVVDDCGVNRKIAKRMMEKLGATVATVNDGQQALDWLAEHGDEVDAVLMDIQMPVMDGFEATEAIRQQPRFGQLPIIAVTAAAGGSHKDAAEKAGMNAFATKPLDVDVLGHVILNLVEESRDTSELSVKADDLEAGQPSASSPSREASLPFSGNWPALPGIDIQFVATRYSLSADRFFVYLDRFVSSFEATSKAFETSDQTPLMKRALVAALSMTVNGAKTVGAWEIEALADRTREALKTETPDVARRHFDELRAVMQVLTTEVRAISRHRQ